MKITSLDHLAEIKEKGLHHTYPDRIKVMVGMATCGVSAGADKVYRALAEKISEYGLDVVLTKTGCIGFCQMEPLVDVVYPGEVRVTYHDMNEEKAGRLVQALNEKRLFEEPALCRIDREEFLVEGTSKHYTGPSPALTELGVPRYEELDFFGSQKKISLRNCGFIDPESLEEYISRGGYHALFKAVTEMKPEQVIAQIKESGIRGRGGAGFPTGVKWEFCRQAHGDVKYVICNADEGDPGAFMDRSILEGDPHSVLEGMAIGAYAMGANQGYIYCRAEYPMAISHLKTAITQARSYGLLGEQIFGRPFSFDVTIREGAGAFVCGEETALIASIEGRVGEPRPRPPFPAQSGLWGKPTVINNVKTWSQISPIVARGAKWYASLGDGNHKGTTVFSLVGKVKNSGLVEVPLGITLGEMIFGLGGGISEERTFKAVQTGGPSGGCIPAEHLNTPVNYDSLAALGSIMGSGGMIVMDDQDCMVNVAKYFLEFTRDESCGKCTPCREGTQRLHEILEAITDGRGSEGDIEKLEKMALMIKKTALCGLGATAPNPVLTTIRYFRDEYEAHIIDKKCPAAVCKALFRAPCQHSCPVQLDIPGYVGLIREGKFAESYAMIKQRIPFPSICGRICDHPCESRCRRAEVDDPIAIRDLKRFVADWAFENDYSYTPPQKEKKKEKVAIIGAGPAGLSAAWDLAVDGYQVTVFEAQSVAGGLLALVIPDYRLPKNIVQKEVDEVARLGVDIRLNTRVTDAEALLEGDYQAVFIATGASLNGMKLQIPGEELEGVHDALDYLREVNLGRGNLPGRRIAVIGGGNSAIDAARVALRKGAEEVSILYRREKGDMPAIAEEIEAAEAEGIHIHCLTTPVEVLGKGGKVVGLRCARMGMGKFDRSGRKRPVPIQGSEFDLNVDMVLKAIGQKAEAICVREDGNVRVDKTGKVVTDPRTMATNAKGIFAGGELATGPATAILAIAAGQRAASSIKKYLQGQELSPRMERDDSERIPAPADLLSEEDTGEKPRIRATVLPPHVRKDSFDEVLMPYSEQQARAEAARCLRCDLASAIALKDTGEYHDQDSNKREAG